MRSSLVTAAVAVSVVLGSAPAAHAEKWHHKDATDDVTVSRGAPYEGDITRLSVDYGPHKIRIDVRTGALSLVDGPPSISPSADPHIRLRGSDHQSWDVFVSEPIPSPPGTVTASLSQSGQLVSCSGLSVTADAAAATWRVVLPAGCIDQPHWVKVGALIQVSDGFTSTFDDALKDGPSPFAVKPRLGAQVQRH